MNSNVSATDAAAPTGIDDASRRWFDTEVYPHDAQLKAHLRYAFPGMRDVEDVVQDSYLRIWKAHALLPIRSAKSLLYTIARRLALNTRRHERRSPVVGVQDLDLLCAIHDKPDAADAAVLAQEIELLTEAIETLPARCREVFVLRRLKGMPQKEIAVRLGISEETVQSQAAKGLRRCEKFLLRRLGRSR